MKNQSGKAFLFLALIAVLSSVTGCTPWLDTIREIEKNDEQHFYFINPVTILAALDRGNTDVFSQMKATPQATSPETVSWPQADYLRIAQALQQKSWQEPFGVLNLYNLDFGLDCSDIGRGGFSRAGFAFYKLIQTGEKETRVEYRFHIMPLKNLVYTSRTEFSPNIYAPPYQIDLAQYQISAEAALQIAEENGGTEKRLENGNTCQINVLAPGPDGKGWRVTYVDNQNKLGNIFKIAVDPQTGAFKVLESKP